MLGIFAATPPQAHPFPYCCARLIALVTALVCSAACQTRGPDDAADNSNVPVGNTNEALTEGEPNLPALPAADGVGIEPNEVTPHPPPAEPNKTIDPGPPTSANPNFQLVGRFDMSDPNGPIMSWPGSKVIAGFSGTSLTVQLKAVDQQDYYGIGNVDNYVQVVIDGNAAAVYPIKQNVTRYVLAQNLAAGNHTVEITKRTEGQIGSLQFLGFTLDPNATLVPGPAPRTRRIEFIGDSGTVGYGADGNWAATRCSFTPATENATVAYSMLTGDLLAAQVHVTANSGKGIFQNRDTVNDKYNTLPVLWTWTSGDTRAQPADPNAATWKPSAWVADAVVLIVGGNDFAASTPQPPAYNETAVKFLKTLRAAYPNAWIFVAISPMLDPPVPGKSGASTSETGIAYAETMVATMADSKVVYLPLTLDDGSRGYGCDYHLNAASHRLTAKAIAAQIASRLNWQL